jgi:hypothetical protein
MPQAEHEASSGTVIADLASLVRDVHALLVDAKMRLDDEIRRYPTPIPRCDAQFNFLYEQRARLQEEINGVAGAMAAATDRESCVAVLDAFVGASPFTDLPDERALRSRASAWIAEHAPALRPDARSDSR